MTENDYISRNEIYDALNDIGGCDASDEWAKGYDAAIDEAIRIVENMPAANVVPIVRCKDCKHCVQSEVWVCYCRNKKGLTDIVKPDDFCSCGERKDGDKNDS